MIFVKDLSFCYGKKPILQGVSFHVGSGTLTFVLGKNGAGKSTLFRCILGLLPSYQGSIMLADQEVRTMTARQIARRVAYIPQTHFPSFNYSVLDMVLMGTTNQVSTFSSPQTEQIEIAKQSLEELGISDLQNRGYANLSGGEQQLVLIARALAQQAPVLLMDEPTSSLDFGNQFRVMKRVKQLTEKGYTIVMSCHNPQHVLSFADQVIALNDGAVFRNGMPHEVMDENLMETLYHVQVSFAETSLGRLIVPR